jgi:hypothetical protein
MKFLNKYPLSAKNIKKAMKHYGINPLRCCKGNGATKEAALITVKAEDYDKTAKFFKEFGIVNYAGITHRKPSTSMGTADFGACYMSEEMYKELNS